MEANVEIDVLEKEIQRVFKKLPSVCCDINSVLFIIQTLDNAFKEVSGRPVSTNY